MRIADDQGWSQDAAANHFLKEEGSEDLRSRAIAIPARIDEVAGLAGEGEVPAQVVTAGGGLDAGLQPKALLVQGFDHRLVPVHVHDRQRCSQRMCLGTVGRGQQKDPVAIVVKATEPHNLAPADHRGDCETVAERLFER